MSKKYTKLDMKSFFDLAQKEKKVSSEKAEVKANSKDFECKSKPKKTSAVQEDALNESDNSSNMNDSSNESEPTRPAGKLESAKGLYFALGFVLYLL